MSESCRCSNNPRKLVSTSSVTNKGLPSSFVALMNCNKQGWWHLEAIFISLSNKRLLWGDRINSWICFTATWQPLSLPRTTVPHPPTPKHLSDKWISSLDNVQSQVSFCLYYVINGVDNVNWPPYRDWKADFSSEPMVKREDEQGDRFREHLRDVEKDDKDASKPVARHFNLLYHSKVGTFSYIRALKTAGTI